ncbi:hypothetical protein B194_3817 [Serratia plymuthica A30]|jgi:hypothetical protein|uniref:Uncharacterized protein n=1 Tax=Serratia plymuthica S13 TaxID=1348660 RepID=S4YSI8_SERPL|nr:hypothetical protein M621_17985 [Serratia plymuthica S13]EKF63378.1 hypothetical protein B194_3817 [Serratia plymuthica A30]
MRIVLHMRFASTTPKNNENAQKKPEQITDAGASVMLAINHRDNNT